MPTFSRTIALIVVSSLAVAACSGSGRQPASPNTGTADVPESPDTGAAGDPSSPSVERWRYVALGDSTHMDVAPAFARIIEDELGVEVDLRAWINPDLASYDVGGERASDLVDRLRTDEELRADLRQADVITFVVPLGLLIDLCPFDPVTYQPAGTRAQARACWPKVLSRYEADVDAFFEELVAIRSPSEALIRVVDNYQYFWERLHDLGVYDLTRRYWPKMNDTIRAAAAKHGIPVVHAYDEFNGPRGQTDGVAAGNISSDQLHPTLEGAERLAEMLADLGFEPGSD